MSMFVWIVLYSISALALLLYFDLTIYFPKKQGVGILLSYIYCLPMFLGLGLILVILDIFENIYLALHK